MLRLMRLGLIDWASDAVLEQLAEQAGRYVNAAKAEATLPLRGAAVRKPSFLRRRSAVPANGHHGTR